VTDRDVEQADKARKLMVEACAEWIDQWDWTAGSIVTGFVVVMETARPDGTLDCTWATGTGGDVKEGDAAGLPPWRVEGMAHRVIRDINIGNVQGAS
jgi:hypothetical protein